MTDFQATTVNADADALFAYLSDVGNLSARRIRWGSEGPNDYHGSLEVIDIHTGSGAGAEVTVRLHTTRMSETDTGIQDDLNATLVAIKRLVEDQYAIT